MGRNYAVLDQNVISDATVVSSLQRAHRRRGRQIVLSSFARFEMTKGGLDGFLKDVAEISKDPDSVVVALPTLIIARYEFERGDKVDVVDRTSTENLRMLLHAIRSEAVPKEILSAGFLEDEAAAARQVRMTDWDSFYLSTVKSLTNPKLSSERERKEVAAGLHRKDRGPLRRALLETFGSRSKLIDLVEGLDAVKSKAKELCSFPSMVALNIMANITVAYHFTMKGTPPKTGWENYAIDVEGAILACRGETFATEDGLAQDVFQDLRFFAKQIWS